MSRPDHLQVFQAQRYLLGWLHFPIIALQLHPLAMATLWSLLVTSVLPRTARVTGLQKIMVSSQDLKP
jgi:hypothetical protein